MIPYVEIRDKYTLKMIDIIEPQECWFELSYQAEGECEVFCRASAENLNALKEGNYIVIPNKRFIWVITGKRYTFTAGGARMIVASGYEAKWLLKKRCILSPKELQGTITKSVYGLVSDNMGNTASAARKINGFAVDTNDLLIDISGTQAARGNLKEFVNPLLKSYNCGSSVFFENGTLKYTIFTGNIKTASVKFSQSLDNLLSSEYYMTDAEKATAALVVSNIDNIDYTQTHDTGAVGIDRSEIIVNSNLATKYEDANGVERETTPDSTLYKGWQIAEGKNALAEHITKEEINGEIDIANSNYTFDVDFFIGDTVKIQDEYFNFSQNVLISKYTIKQDSNGYGEAAEYGGINNGN